ncbi:transcription initiation factor IIE subunit beta [Fomitiporia mediterranea MF3/22]|uniref:transcription initiation factor IIE subunit beta n=1 Tax=Fomitiporia mediterranea (strain MF3/22) TaxID=694068 RepID=UPI00044090DA|nr:transcription initiation factor IIE subunit beta [Fomitiporia mediterranea MF3/22]EJD04949.1 transcription initiation factor IIE subunit beta [Fomitiporia mediterranea MF3/22]
MSALARDAAAFKSSLQRQDFTSWHSNPSLKNNAPPPSSGTTASSTTSTSSETAKKKRPKPNIVYSQPADTGTGTDINTQIVYAVDHLKNNGNPMRLQDLAIVTGTLLDTNPALRERFKAHDRVVYDPKTDLYSYRHDFTFRNKAALITEVQRHTRRGGGLSVRALKESWKDAPQAIEELEKEGEVLVTRTTKDQQMRMVFWNELKPVEGTGGLPVEQEFKDLWHKLKVPPDADLLKALSSEGLKATEGETVIPKAPQGKKKGKKAAPRHRLQRITNVHLKGDIDLSKDYTPTK